MNAYLSIDLGTTGCRSVVFDEKFNMLAYDYEEYGLITTKENHVEQDSELWWSLTIKTAVSAIEKSGIPGTDIKSISISSQGITIVPVDENITPLYNAISWLDTRSDKEAEQIRKDMGFDEILKLTGKRIDAVYTLPKLLWIKKNLPGIYAKAYKFLMPLEFLVARFTGRYVTDHSMASGTLMYDIENACWSKKILDFYSIDEEKLPEILCAGERAGKVVPDVAKKLGLSENCIVAVGGQDQKCAAYGAGVNEETVTVSLGTAAAITIPYNAELQKKGCGLGKCGYVTDEFLVTEGVVNTAGTCLRWIRDLLFKGESYDVINAEAKKALEKESSLLFYPYLGGASSPFFYPESTGCFYGMNLSTTRGDMALAVMEGVAFQIKTLIDVMIGSDQLTGIVLFGGGASGDVWPQLICDITGVAVKIPKTEQVASLGAAMLASKAIGNEAAALEIREVYVPTKEKDKYKIKYERYRELEKKLWGKECEKA